MGEVAREEIQPQVLLFLGYIDSLTIIWGFFITADFSHLEYTSLRGCQTMASSALVGGFQSGRFHITTIWLIGGYYREDFIILQVLFSSEGIQVTIFTLKRIFRFVR